MFINIDNYWDQSIKPSKPSLLSRYVKMARHNLYLSGGSSGFNNNDDRGKLRGGGDDGGRGDGGSNIEDGYGEGLPRIAAFAPLGNRKLNDNCLNFNVIK